MRRLLPLVVALVLLGGCGAGDEESGGAHTETLPPGPQATDLCLGERGFALRPATTGISAVSPTGAQFTVVFFDTQAEAAEAADRTEGSTAVATAVVTPAQKSLTQAELATVEECIGG